METNHHLLDTTEAARLYDFVTTMKTRQTKAARRAHREAIAARFIDAETAAHQYGRSVMWMILYQVPAILDHPDYSQAADCFNSDWVQDCPTDCTPDKWSEYGFRVFRRQVEAYHSCVDDAPPISAEAVGAFRARLLMEMRAA
jgi:hypothetical protein